MILLDNSSFINVPFSQGKRVNTNLVMQTIWKRVLVSAQQLGITRLPGNFPDKIGSRLRGKYDHAETQI
ncbi:MAG: hypothetical protein KJO28_05265 [Desulfofustis sp.]|nr:hypothetical protein [Desulfofustis sp.]